MFTKKKYHSTVKRLTSKLITLSMISSTISPYALADQNAYQDQIDQNKKTRNTQFMSGDQMGTLIQGAGQIYQQANQIKQGNINQMMRANEMAKIQQSITPPEFPDDFMFGCKNIVSDTNKIAGLCASIANEMDYQEALLVEAQAIQNVDLYKDHIEQGNKLGSNVGVACMKEQLSLQKSNMLEELKKIDQLILEVEQRKADLARKVQPFQRQMEQIQRDLDGDPNKKIDLANILPQPSQCKDIINRTEFTKNKGLNGLNATTLKNVDVANDFTKKKDKIVEDINQDLARLAQRIDQRSEVASLASTAGEILKMDDLATLNQYAGAKIVKGDIEAKMGTDMAKLKNEFESLDLSQFSPADRTEITRAVQDPSRDLASSLSRASRTIKNKCLSSYFNRSDWESSTIEQVNVSSSSNIKDYYDYIEQIINSPEYANHSMDSKVALIAEYEKTHGYNALRIKTNFNTTKDRKGDLDTISRAMQRYSSTCESAYKTTEVSNGLTFAKLEKKLQEIKNSRKSILTKNRNNIVNQIRSRILSCEGVSYKMSPSTCGPDKLKPTSSDFCVTQSTSCASQMLSCNAEVVKAIENKQTARKMAADNMNNMIKAEKVQMQLKLQEAVVISKNIMDNIKKFYPQTNFTIATDFGSNIGALNFTQQNGEEVLDPAEPADIMLENLKKIRLSIAGKAEADPANPDINPVKFDSNFSGGQYKQIIELIQDHVNLTAANNEKEMEAWAKLATDCRTNANTFAKQRQENIDKQNEAIGKTNKAITNFCAPANAVTATPGCGTVSKLVDTVADVNDEIASELTTEDQILMGKIENYNYLCNNSQSHDSTPGSRSPASSMTTEQICKQGGYSTKDACVKKAKYDANCTSDYYTKLNKKKACTNQGDEEKAKPECVKALNLTEISYCGTNEDATRIELKSELEELVVDYNNAKLMDDAAKEIGEQSFELCNSTDDSGQDVLKNTIEGLKDMQKITPTATTQG